MKIGIFGGSFDPPHKGHKAVSDSAVSFLSLDRLFIVPSYITPGAGEAVASPEDRYNMCNWVFCGENITVSDYEIKSRKVSYTYETVMYFRSEYKNDELFLIIGSDKASGLVKWKNFAYLKNEVTFAVVPRVGTAIDLTETDANFVIIDAVIPDISSTEIRNGNMRELFDPQTKEYIENHGLYLGTK